MSQLNETILEDNLHSFKLQFNCPAAWRDAVSNNCGRTNINNCETFMKSNYSSKHNVADKIIFQCMFLVTKNSIDFFVLFKRKILNDTRDYTIILCVWEKSETDKEYKPFKMDGSWHSVRENLTAGADYIVELEIKLAPLRAPHKSLYKDSAYTDLELCGIDGSVHMHRVVAEACSPWFKTLFSGPRIEADSGVVNVKEATVATLQHLKDYMYLGKVPESGDLKELIALSSFYLMEDLEMRCAFELSKQVTTENACDLIEFAVKNNLCNLLYEILHIVQRKRVDIHEMEKLHKI